MHEASIAHSIIDVVSRQCAEGGYRHIEAINIRIGRASGIMPDALLFAFDAMKAETIASHAVLRIQEIPVTGSCDDCGGEFTAGEEFVLSCPLCGGGSFRITGGREMDIIDMEVAE